MIQINLNNSRVATAQAAKTAAEENVNIILIQDPYVHNKRLYGFPNGWTCHSSINLRAWVVITGNNIICNKQKQLNTSAFVTITTKTGNLTIGSQYIPPKADIHEHLTEWTTLYEQNQDTELIIGGTSMQGHTLGVTHTKTTEERQWRLYY